MIDEKLLIEELEKTTFTDKIQKKQYKDLLEHLISGLQKVCEWIPCSVDMPKKATVYEVTEEVFFNCKKQYVVEHRLFGTEGEWLTPSNRKVIAWMPLPPAYKGE